MRLFTRCAKGSLRSPSAQRAAAPPQLYEALPLVALRTTAALQNCEKNPRFARFFFATSQSRRALYAILLDNQEIMKILYFFVLTILFSYNFQSKKVELNPLTEIEPINYSKLNEQIQNIRQENNGKFPIIKFERTKGNKHLLYFGEQHGNDPTDSRFDTIQKYLNRNQNETICTLFSLDFI